MDKSRMIRQLLSAPPALRTTLVAYHRAFGTANTYRSDSRTPHSVSQATFWKSIVPKPFREIKERSAVKKPKSKEWNPATFYIIIFLLIGSMSIQMLALRKDSEALRRQTDAKVALLREAIDKVQAGEYVNVEKLLGTGKQPDEFEWDQVLGEFQSGDDIWKQKRKDVAIEYEKSVAKTDTTELDVKTKKVDPPKTPKPVKSNAPKGYY